jgi:hypothetical protein
VDRIVKTVEKEVEDVSFIMERLSKAVYVTFVDWFVGEYLASRALIIPIKDVSKIVDVITKVGFKLAGYDVRRVYFLPTEFKALWDIIESGDHNTKIEICKALIEAFKRVRDKLGE